jgi:hypothetical protein
VTTVGTVAVIDLSLAAFIAFSAKKVAQLHVHQLGQIRFYSFLYVHPNHLKKTFGTLLDRIDIDTSNTLSYTSNYGDLGLSMG